MLIVPYGIDALDELVDCLSSVRFGFVLGIALCGLYACFLWVKSVLSCGFSLKTRGVGLLCFSPVNQSGFWYLDAVGEAQNQ